MVLKKKKNRWQQEVISSDVVGQKPDTRKKQTNHFYDVKVEIEVKPKGNSELLHSSPLPPSLDTFV